MGIFDRERMTIFDGAMGTMLQKKLDTKGAIGETCNIEHPDYVIDIHRAYLDAGCDIIKTNTFSANRYKMSKTPYSVDKTVKAAVACAREAIRQSGRKALVAVGIGPTGRMMQPYGDLSMKEACEVFYEIASAANHTSADMILCETFSDQAELKAALLAAKAAGDLPVVTSMAFQGNGRLLTGASVTSAASLAEALGVEAIGFNCGLGPAQYHELLPELSRATSLPLIFNPNAGLPVLQGEKAVYDIDPESFVRDASELAVYGVRFTGGCCGTTPDHIRVLADLFSGQAVYPRKVPKSMIISGTNKYLRFGGDCVVISGRISPKTDEIKELLQSGDGEGLSDIATELEEDGANAIMVNADGMADRENVIKNAVTGIQELCGLPIVIDAEDMLEIENTLFLYNGRPLVCLPYGKNFDKNAEIAKRYGAALCLKCEDADLEPAISGARAAGIDFLIETRQAMIPRLASMDVPTLMRLKKGDEESREIAIAAGLSAIIME